MITRLMVALLALYLVSGGGKNWSEFSGGEIAGTTGASLSAQAGLAKQAIDFCLAHRDLCAEAAGSLVKSTGSVPALPPPPVLAPATAFEATTPGEAAPDLPLPPRRRSPARGA